MKLKRQNDTLYIQINGRWRILARVTANILFIDKDSIENFVPKYNGYGFNYDLMKDERFSDIMQIDETELNEVHHYTIPRKKILEIGILGEETRFDRQIFLSKNQMKYFHSSTSKLESSNLS